MKNDLSGLISRFNMAKESVTWQQSVEIETEKERSVKKI